MNICYLTCLNARPKVSRIGIECFARLKESNPLYMIAAYSDDVDLPLLKESQERLTHLDFIQVPNKPLGKKWNTVLEYALKSSQNFTHFLIMGDDDSLSDDGMDDLTTLATCYIDNSFYHYAGFNSNGYYDLHSGKSMIHKYKYERKLIGAGRLISREAIETTTVRQQVIMRKEYFKYKVGERYNLPIRTAEYLEGYGYAKRSGELIYEGLWPNDAKQSLDHWSELKLVHAGFIPVSVDDGRIHLTDFKTNANMWPYSILENKCTPAKPEDLTWFLNDREREIINEFK